MDDFNIFYGALDRYAFKLVGKTELIVPYNDNRLRLVPPDQQFASHTINPDHSRWEVHRVWTVEATLSDGKRNAVTKRKIYLDEDTWQALIGEEWDASGGLWRHILAIPLNICDAPGTITWGNYAYDFHTGLVASNAVSNPSSKPFQIMPNRFPADLLTPDGMAAQMAR
jgi:hypothetical protein